MNKQQPVTRHFSKLILLGTIMLSVAVGFSGCNSSAQKDNSSQEDSSAQNLKPSDWKLGIQAWSFHLDPFSVALNKMDSCGVKYVEGFPGQEIGNGIEGKMDYHMSADKRKAVKKMLDKHGITMVSYGVVTPKTDSDWKQLFKFAEAMDLQNIVSEPKEEQIPLISKLCDKYKINVAIHNHAKPTSYWNPETVLETIEGASPRIGACADVGHWLESGLDPIECLKKLKGHVIEFHMKDENKKGGGKGAHDVPMGKGVINMAGIMQQMKQQNFKGFVLIEHEYHFKNNVPEVKAGAEYFRQEKQKLLK